MRVLLTGGSACGKSTYAERLVCSLAPPRWYVATMRPFDEECTAKIARHREMRAQKGFETLERYTGLDRLRLPQRGVVLLECLCNLTANEMFDPEGAGERAVEAVLSGVRSLAGQSTDIIVVTNDVASDGGGYPAETTRYITALGEINNRLAAEFDTVYELCCGIPIVLKGRLP